MIRILVAVWVLVAMAAAFLAPDAKGFQSPALARIVFFHLPCAFLATGYLFAGSFYAVKFLKGRSAERDETESARKSVAANELGYLFAVLTMVTGILFSYVQWGTWWQWDPRQTSFLMLLLLYSAYFALRSAHGDPDRREVVASAYAVALVLPAVFLIFVFPRLPQIANVSFHPTQTIQQGQFDRNYWTVLLANFFGLLMLSVPLFRLRIRAEALAHRRFGEATGAAARATITRKS
ncbi:MAG: cytochrome c biogenesis protein CcsA [Fimbriimonadaceae bacterium]|nr:cytochrome c biogenesis protein CcsA [Fimbriimonadaceae bacterium]